MKWLFLGASLSLFSLVSAPVFAEGNPISCDKLTSHLSDNKDYYIFTAQASGDNTSITGYYFDFGDHQSYVATFSVSDQDHQSAVVTHTYRSPGNYTIKVSVTTKSQNKTSSMTSDACKTIVQIGNPTALPNAGAQGVIASMLTVTTMAFLAHQAFLRRRLHRLTA